MSDDKTIGIIGGSGALGGALARRWAGAGYSVLVGSRTAEKAQEFVRGLDAVIRARITGCSNTQCAAQAGMLVMTVPWSAQESTLLQIRSQVQGKILVDTTVPLVPPKVMRVQLPPEGSAAMRAQQLLGAGVQVVAAFHNVAAHRLATDATIDCDVLIFGDQKEAREAVVTLAKAAGLRGLHAGSLANSAAAEALTSVLIFMNRTYGADGAGMRITGLPGTA